jgi:hypothetical protein
VDRSFMVSILLCRSKSKHGKSGWVIEPFPVEREYITLLCTMNCKHDRVLDYYILPKMTAFKRVHRSDSWLRTAVRLHNLADFYTTVKGMWAQRSNHDTILKYLQEL